MGLLGKWDDNRYRPREGESRPAFLRRLAVDGLPFLGYAEALRSPVWELSREVTVLREEVDALKAQVEELRTQLDRQRPRPRRPARPSAG